MKQSFLLLSVFLLSLAAMAQGSGLRKVYAYAQGSLPGIRQEVQVIEGSEQQKTVAETADERVSYSIYAEQSGSSKGSISTAWIKGRAYPVKADKVNTPVEMKTVEEENGDGKIVLAPASRQSVWAITLGTLYKKQPVAS